MSTLKEKLVELIHSFPRRDLRTLQAPEQHRDSRRPSDFFIFYTEHNISFRGKSNREIKDVKDETKIRAKRPRKDKIKAVVKKEVDTIEREPKATEKNGRNEGSSGNMEKARISKEIGGARLQVSKIGSRVKHYQEKEYEKGDFNMNESDFEAKGLNNENPSKNTHKSSERLKNKRSSRKEPETDINRYKNLTEKVDENQRESPHNHKFEELLQTDESTDSPNLSLAEKQSIPPIEVKNQNLHADATKKPTTSINIKNSELALKISNNSKHPTHPEAQSNEIVQESEITNDSKASVTSDMRTECISKLDVQENQITPTNSSEKLPASTNSLPSHYSPPQFSNIQNKSFSEPDSTQSCCSKCYIL